jgi:hypothetical protein
MAIPFFNANSAKKAKRNAKKLQGKLFAIVRHCCGVRIEKEQWYRLFI